MIPTRHRVLALLALIVGCFSLHEAAAADCEVKVASDKLPYRQLDKNGNQGVKPGGFITPQAGSQVVNGIDVSKYQSEVDFELVRRCGGTFAYVRLSAGAYSLNETTGRDHWKNAKGVGLLVGGYHNIFMNNPLEPFDKATEVARATIEGGNIEEARKQAKLFIDRLLEVLALEHPESAAVYGDPYLPAVLDLTWQPQVKFGTSAQKAFAPGYRKAICAWVDRFHEDGHFRQQPVIFFTTPKIFETYELEKLTCRNDDRWWISFKNRTGGSAFEEKGGDLKLIQAMCGSSDSPGRCIFDQYTSFGGFAVFEKDAAIDLDRFYGNVESLRALLQSAPKLPEDGKQ